MNKTEFLQRFHHIRNVTAETDFPLTQKSRQAAVLIPIIEHEHGLTILFTKRAMHLKHHPGQISFPGGKVETTDKSLEHTALRETYEEVGIQPKQVNVLGKLPQYRTISRYNITPVIGLVNAPIAITIDQNEVDQAFEIPLCHVCDPHNHIAYPVMRNGIHQTLYFIPFESHMIWGVTASIIRNLSNHLYDISR